MKFIKPKSDKKKVNWSISENSLLLLAIYSKYCGYSEEDIVDEFVENLIADETFVKWMKSQRYTKKMDALIDYYDIDSKLGS